MQIAANAGAVVSQLSLVTICIYAIQHTRLLSFLRSFHHVFLLRHDFKVFFVDFRTLSSYSCIVQCMYTILLYIVKMGLSSPLSKILK